MQRKKQTTKTKKISIIFFKIPKHKKTLPIFLIGKNIILLLITIVCVVLRHLHYNHIQH